MTETTIEARIAGRFGLTGDSWSRHANPVSVWTRFAVVPLLAAAIWSRDWIGWWSLAAVALVLVYMVINPLLFRAPRSTANWASKAVLGERLYTQRNTIEIPAQFGVSRVPAVTYAAQTAGLALTAYGLVELGWFGLVAVVAGLVIVQCSKAWFLDRAVLLFEDMKTRNPEYARWEYSDRKAEDR